MSINLTLIMKYTAGNKGDNVRSDCWVELTLEKRTGLSISIDSKVDILYGHSIKELCLSILQFFNIKDAHVSIIDKGALDFIIAARLEAAICKARANYCGYLPESARSTYTTEKKQNRFSRLYIPGNSPKLMINSGIYGSHGVILDLEDSVAFEKKDEARILIRNALRVVDFKSSERMVRINQLPLGLIDLEFLIPEKPNLVLVPKCENADQVIQIDEAITDLNSEPAFPIYIMPIIESALGVVNACDIAKASSRNVALAIGLEDYTADIGAQRTNKGIESFYARSAVVNAAHAAGIQPIDSVFSDVNDMDTLVANVMESRSLGFVGMGCIHPRQVSVINENFCPNAEEIDRAKKVVAAFDEAQKLGLGVVSLGSKMIDPPVVERALNTISVAIGTGKLNKNWRAENG